MIYTSNYARQSSNPLSVSISRDPPDYFQGEHFLFLAPTWDMVMGVKENRLLPLEFTKMYLTLLKERKIDPQIIADLPDGTMLLCYEGPSDFCHRHILATWVESKIGISIPEWKNEKELAKSQQEALVDSLFDSV